MEFILLIILLLLVLVLIGLQLKSKTSVSKHEMSDLLKQEFNLNRQELTQGLRDNRDELNHRIESFQKSFYEALQSLTEKVNEKLIHIQEGSNLNAEKSRDYLSKNLKEFQTSFTENVKTFNDLQKQKFDEMKIKQDELVKSTEEKLEKMRETVDEKLHKTLEERLGQSFQLVSDKLEAVQKGLGEMQTLATGVGDLKKVLSNVKTRGVLGEIQLGNILEQIMAPEQYASNVKTKKGSHELVEYAIKLPGKDGEGNEVYLPIDAKFPQEDYVRLQTAYDVGDVLAVDQATKALLNAIKKFAKDIHNKYIDPPHTTDFGILFLPIEGLFAEVVRHPEIIETLQRDYKIIVTGPTTLAAMLNSLQMGFKTLAIQKRSSEVWDILKAVKTEFGKFGSVLDKAKQKIQEAGDEIDLLVTTRTRMMMSKMKKIEEMPTHESNRVIEEGMDENDILPEENS